MSILKKTVFLLFIAVVSAVNLSAETIAFRLGKVYAAEITRSRVYVSGLKDTSFKIDFSSRAYAVVIVRLQPGRSLSLYDFKLRIAGTDYPCVGLRSGNSSFSFSKWKIYPTNPGDFYSLLFIVNTSKINSSAKTVEGTLLYNLSSEGMVKTNISFKNSGDAALTSSSDIPEKGMFNTASKEKISK